MSWTDRLSLNRSLSYLRLLWFQRYRFRGPAQPPSLCRSRRTTCRHHPSKQKASQSLNTWCCLSCFQRAISDSLRPKQDRCQVYQNRQTTFLTQVSCPRISRMLASVLWPRKRRKRGREKYRTLRRLTTTTDSIKTLSTWDRYRPSNKETSKWHAVSYSKTIPSNRKVLW